MKRRAGTLVLVAAAALVATVPAPSVTLAKGKKCKAYQPGELGADADTTVVTDKATEDSPIEVTLEILPGAGFTSTDPGGDQGATQHAYHNVQVDPKAKTTALFARIEFLPTWDHDLFLRTSDGTAVAWEADFNQLSAGLGSNSGGHAEQGASQIDGFPSADCAGYTVDVASSVGGGPDVAMTLWLDKP